MEEYLSHKANEAGLVVADKVRHETDPTETWEMDLVIPGEPDVDMLGIPELSRWIRTLAKFARLAKVKVFDVSFTGDHSATIFCKMRGR